MTATVTAIQQGRFNFYSHFTIEGAKAGEQGDEVRAVWLPSPHPLTTRQAGFYASQTASDSQVIVQSASFLLCGPSPPLCRQHLDRKRSVADGSVVCTKSQG